MAGLLAYAALGAIKGGAEAAGRGWREQAKEARDEALYEKHRDEERQYNETKEYKDRLYKEMIWEQRKGIEQTDKEIDRQIADQDARRRAEEAEDKARKRVNYSANMEAQKTGPRLYFDANRKPLPDSNGAVFYQEQEATGFKDGKALGYRETGDLKRMVPLSKEQKPYYTGTMKVDGQDIVVIQDTINSPLKTYDHSIMGWASVEQYAANRKEQDKIRLTEINRVAQADIAKARGMALEDAYALLAGTEQGKLGATFSSIEQKFPGLNLNIKKFYHDISANQKAVKAVVNRPEWRRYEKLIKISPEMKDYVDHLIRANGKYLPTPPENKPEPARGLLGGQYPVIRPGR